jgi:hypothetical protein
MATVLLVLLSAGPPFTAMVDPEKCKLKKMMSFVY